MPNINLKEGLEMPYLNVDATTRLYYEDQGSGQPIVFVPGLWGSSRNYRNQLSHFGDRGYRAIALDPRGAGRSSHIHSGHTVAQYARDLRALMQSLELVDTVLAGWSMGALIIWDYFKQFGTENIKANVVIDQMASDFKWGDWSFGIFDFSTLCQLMASVQTDQLATVESMFPSLVFKNPPGEDDLKALVEDATGIPETIASAILFDQSVQDYRQLLSSVTVPTLLCFGVTGLGGAEGGEYMRQNLPNARLVMFENSGHMIPLEEPTRFNIEVEQFISSLG